MVTKKMNFLVSTSEAFNFNSSYFNNTTRNIKKDLIEYTDTTVFHDRRGECNPFIPRFLKKIRL